jgi:hypothetical protein
MPESPTTCVVPCRRASVSAWPISTLTPLAQAAPAALSHRRAPSPNAKNAALVLTDGLPLGVLLAFDDLLLARGVNLEPRLFGLALLLQSGLSGISRLFGRDLLAFGRDLSLTGSDLSLLGLQFGLGVGPLPFSAASALASFNWPSFFRWSWPKQAVGSVLGTDMNLHSLWDRAGAPKKTVLSRPSARGPATTANPLPSGARK